MLEEMRIQGLGVIEEAVLELDPGLTVVTGETGAGKTMVVTGLSLLLGVRADAGLVRPGTDDRAGRAVVEGRVRVDPAGAVARRADEAGAELDDDTLILMRTISGEGRSRAYAGGAGVPASMLAELAESLVTIHGQSDQIRLLRPARQRALLDAFAGESVAEPLETYRQRYARLSEVRARLEDLTTRARERAQEADMLRFGLEEIAAVDPQPGEDEALAAEDARLAHADGLRTAAEQAHAAAVGAEDASAEDGDALTILASARKLLDAVRAHDPELAGLADRIGEAAALTADVGADLASYATSIDTDPARLAAVGERRAALATLTRKYGDTIDAVLAWASESTQRLSELDGSSEQVTELEEEYVRLRTELGELAAQLSQVRVEAAARLGEAATVEVAELAMPHAAIAAEVSRQEVTGEGLEVDGRQLSFGPHGVDEVELTLTPHPGAGPRPLQRGASGGELSRVMLAVELTTAAPRTAGHGPTFVFDEVDAGVGGKAAVEIGRRLARLASTSQVVVVTHLPQVAAFADRHYVVRKSSDGSVTRSGLSRLEDGGRVEELARMLAGLEESETARAHAQELLTTAANAKSATARSTTKATGGRGRQRRRP